MAEGDGIRMRIERRVGEAKRGRGGEEEQDEGAWVVELELVEKLEGWQEGGLDDGIGFVVHSVPVVSFS